MMISLLDRIDKTAERFEQRHAQRPTNLMVGRKLLATLASEIRALTGHDPELKDGDVISGLRLQIGGKDSAHLGVSGMIHFFDRNN